MIGQIIGGRYQIFQLLGKGGFGITFLAIDKGRPGNPHCVVKLLKPMSNDPRTLEVGERLFQREAEKLEILGNHDQIPRLLAHFQENQEFYLVQEYIEGHDLSRELVAATQLSEAYVTKLLHDILEVLVLVHQQNLVHRDLKPSNIRRRKSDQKIVLIDFGAVKEITIQIVNPQGQTRVATQIGTPGYMPVEQAMGQTTLSSDIYAVGVIAIQALTGINPNPHNAGGLPTHPQTKEIVWRDRTQVSRKLANIIDKMVRHNSNQRYQSATKALQAIEALSAKPNWKVWLGMGVVAITALILWMLYQVFNPKPTFSTYQENNSGITIKYPSNWRPIKEAFSDEVILFLPKNQKQANSCILEVTTNINDLSPHLLSLEEYKNTVIQKIKNNNPEQQITDDTQPSTILSNFHAYKLSYTRQDGQCQLKVMEIGTVRHGKAYFITYTAEKKEYNKYLEIAQTMIDSFAIKPQ
ncbi:serine/threonine protein kinase [Mastigocladus laminosus UU774]|nr:serine/threonine protein kinase [Mastigocladus laminosus UU774]